MSSTKQRALTIHDLPGECLVHCLALLPQAERFKAAALVSKRFHRLTLSSELLRRLKLDIPAAQASHRLVALPPWLLKHAGSLQHLEIATDLPASGSKYAALLDVFIGAAAAGSRSTLQRLSLTSRYGQHAAGMPWGGAYTLGAWLVPLVGLQHLAITLELPMKLALPLAGLTQLRSLALEAHDLVAAAPATKLPPLLTRLSLVRSQAFQGHVQHPFQIGQLQQLRALRLDGYIYHPHGLADCPGALVTGLSALQGSLVHLSLRHATLGAWLPSCTRGLTALQTLELVVGRSHEQAVDDEAASAALDATLRQLPQLTGLWLEGDFPSGFPAAAARLARLRWLCWVDGHSDPEPLPEGPYRSSLQRLLTPFRAASNTLPALAGMGQLQRLSLVDTPDLVTEGRWSRNEDEWHAFWRWAERHPPLRCLDFLDSGPDFDGVIPTKVVNALLELKGRRPQLRVRGHEDFGRDSGPYRRELLLAEGEAD